MASAAFEHWSESCHAAKVAAQLQAQARRADELASTSGSLEAQLRGLRDEYERRLASAEEAKRIALERQLTELTGSAEERTRVLEEKAKEQRIELLRRQVARRMFNSGLASGWAAWHDFWAAKVYAVERLRHVANRVRAPDTSMTFDFWARQASAQKARTATLQSEARTLQLERERDDLREHLETLRAESERKLAEVASDRLALLDKVSQLTGNASDADALLQVQMGKDRQERIELLRRQMLRRMCNRDLSLGFTAWTEMWQAKLYASQKLMQVASRLHSPERSDAFTWWAAEAHAQ